MDDIGWSSFRDSSAVALLHTDTQTLIGTFCLQSMKCSDVGPPDRPARLPAPGPVHQEGDEDEEEENGDGNDASEPLRQHTCCLSMN